MRYYYETNIGFRNGADVVTPLLHFSDTPVFPTSTFCLDNLADCVVRFVYLPNGNNVFDYGDLVFGGILRLQVLRTRVGGCVVYV